MGSTSLYGALSFSPISPPNELVSITQARPDHGDFSPRVVPFSHSSEFVLQDRKNGSRITLVNGQGAPRPLNLPGRTEALAVSRDDQWLVALVCQSGRYRLVRRPLNRDRHGRVAVDTRDSTTVSVTLKIKGPGPLSLSHWRATLEMIREGDRNVALVALTNGDTEKLFFP